MGFFQDLKEDLSQAVNELMPEDELNEGVENMAEETDVETADTEMEEDLTVALAAALEKLPETRESLQEEEEMAEVLEETEAEETMMVEADQEEESKAEEALEEEFVEKDSESPEEILQALEHKKEESNLEKEVDLAMTADTTENEMEEVLDETATITSGMVINGDLETKGSVDILGTINGNVNALGKLNISGSIQGNSMAAEVFADSAHITGEVKSKGSVKIGQSSVVIGNIIATSAVIAGAIKGDIDVKGPVILDTSAIVMGNIKSKSVQINNGAVIEGMCSQCYADVNPTSFFEDYNTAK